MSPLESSGKPLFFRVADASGSGIVAPANPGGVGLRTVSRSLALMQKEALVASSPSGVLWRLASDEGAYLMGDDVAPCPLSFMTVGMIASFMEQLVSLARAKGIPLPGLRLVQDNYYTMEGSALRGTMIGGALPVELCLEVESAESVQELERLLSEAIAASPACALVRSTLPSRFTLTHNGREVRPRKVLPIGLAPERCSHRVFETDVPAAGDWSGLVRKNGMSPKTAEVTSSSGSSYAAEQSRRLHLRAICTMRPDGMKSIEQQLFNPHGSIFHFLSEEGAERAGEERAPDAMTYLSAGIAFCFMTQFGRYAKITGKKLNDYSLVQDTRFSLGAGSAAPMAQAVETHVHLESGEGDEFAQTILDMSEQTCFLHALCRSELGVRPAVRVGVPNQPQR